MPGATPGAMPGAVPPPPIGAPPPPPAGFQVPATGPAKSGKATAALVLGIASIFLFWLLGIVPILAIIFGFLARKEIKASGGRLAGSGKATAGLVLGIIMTILTIVVFVFVALDDSVPATDLEAGQCVEIPDTTGDEVSSFEEQPCDEPHDGEVFYVTELPDGDYPGTSDVVEQAQTICFEEFGDFLNGDPFSSDLDFLTIYPQRSSWDQSRSVSCIAYDPGGELEGGSLEGIQG